MRRASLLAVLLFSAAVLPAAVLPAVARAQPLLVTGMGGTAGFGVDALPRGDSDFGEVIFGTTFPSGISLFGTTYTSLYVNTDGNVSFGGAQRYVTFGIPGATNPMIAAYFADVDTLPGPQTGDPAGANTVYWDATTTGRVVVTWFLVGYADDRVDQRVSAQLILTQAPGMPAGIVDIELRYNRCGWHRAVGSFLSAQAGFDLGDETRFLVLPGGDGPTVVTGTCQGSNVGETGVWRFRSDALPPAMCGNSMRETGEQCDDGNATETPCMSTCRRPPPPDAGEVVPRDAQPPPDDAGGGDGGGGSMDGGGTGDGDGGGGDMDGGTGGDRDGGGGPGDDTLDVFGGGCTVGAGRADPGAAILFVLGLALIGWRARRR